MPELLIFRLGCMEWALPAQAVQQVLPPMPLTRVPGSDPCLRGLVAWRAQVLPVLALGTRLACDDPPVDQGVLLVVEALGERVALAVDEVVCFAHALPSDTCNEPGITSSDASSDTGQTTRQAEIAGHVVRLLDLEWALNER